MKWRNKIYHHSVSPKHYTVSLKEAEEKIKEAFVEGFTEGKDCSHGYEQDPHKAVLKYLKDL